MTYIPYNFFTYQTNGAIMKNNAQDQMLDITYDSAGNLTTIKGPETTGGDLDLNANSTDAYPYIDIQGLGSIYLHHPTGHGVKIVNEATEYLGFYLTGGDIEIYAETSDLNLFLEPRGTGLVKFGTHAVIGAEVVTGYIEILDAAGNTRHLAVTS